MSLTIGMGARRRALIGYTGFIGKSLMSQMDFTDLYRSTDIHEIEGSEFELIVCAGAPATKWHANKFPLEDKKCIDALVSSLGSVKTEKFVLISTIDVYPDISCGGNEDLDMKVPDIAHAYGQNRRWLEMRVIELFGNSACVVRLPALYGRHMKKNWIFDLLHGRSDMFPSINKNSRLQWYNVDRLAVDIESATSAGLPVVNLFPEPLETQEIISTVFPLYQNELSSSAVRFEYDITTKHSRAMGGERGYILSCTDVLQDLQKFCSQYVRMPAALDRLMISMIAWDDSSETVCLKALQAYGILHLECTPSKILGACWHERPQSQYIFKERIAQFGMDAPSMQAILFQKPLLKLFGSEQQRLALARHCNAVLSLASSVGTKYVVWGSPAQRHTGGKELYQCNEIAIKFFRTLSEFALTKGIVVVMEANAVQYGCDFCTTLDDAASLVRTVGMRSFRLHVDTGCMTMSSDPVECILKNADIIESVQISEPFLGSFENPQCNHLAMASVLVQCGYTGLISIEMKSSGTSSLRHLVKALDFVMHTYSCLLQSPTRHISPLCTVCVVGGGWYGCHVACSLADLGMKVVILEAKDQLFQGSSRYNSARLHAGYHYPRSYFTRKQIAFSLRLFKDKYADLFCALPRNYYCIASAGSQLDFGSYKQILRSSNLDFHVVEPASVGITNVEGCIVAHDEGLLLVDEPCRFFQDAFKKRQKNIEVVLNQRVQTIEESDDGVKVNGRDFDWLISCTYNSLTLPSTLGQVGCYYEVCLSLVYRTVSAVPAMAVTVMDGNSEFFTSLFPWAQTREDLQSQGLRYTLTNVKHTPLFKGRAFREAEAFTVTFKEADAETLRPSFESAICHVFPSFKSLFVYDSFFLSTKCKPVDESAANHSASRETLVTGQGRVLNCFSGKIDTIFVAENSVRSYILPKLPFRRQETDSES